MWLGALGRTIHCLGPCGHRPDVLEVEGQTYSTFTSKTKVRTHPQNSAKKRQQDKKASQNIWVSISVPHAGHRKFSCSKFPVLQILPISIFENSFKIYTCLHFLVYVDEIKENKSKCLTTKVILGIMERWENGPDAHAVLSVHFCPVTQSCLTLCDPMDCNMPGLPVHHQLPEFTQTRVHWIGDDIQYAHPLSSPSPPAFNLSQHQDLFKWVSSSHQVAKVLEFQLQHQSFQWIFRTDFL